MIKIIYKPFALIVGVLAGIAAGQVFERIWAVVADEDPADPSDRDASWAEILASSAVHGAVYALVQAVVRRGGMVGFERATGIWPGDQKRD